MRRSDWIAGAIVLAAVAAPPQARAQDVKAGVDAWHRGEFDDAVQQWRGPAVAGDADAQFNLAQAYKLGRGVPLDPVLAESWFRKAALQGHPLAEDNYGLALFQAGRKADAVPWLEKSVQRGEPRCQLVLGTMLFNGDGIARDYPRAYALMTLASQAGLKGASATLADMDGYITAADRERGTALVQRYTADLRKAPPRDDHGGKLAGEALTPKHVETVKANEAAPPPPAAKPSSPRPAEHAAAIRTATVRPAAAPVEQSGHWTIQLGAFSTQANAETQWSHVRAKLANAKPVYAKAGSVTRLQASGFVSKAAAQKACSASGVPCMVMAP